MRGTGKGDLLPALAILGAVALLYGHTLQVPFYLDDQWAIVDKHLLRDLPATLAELFGHRGLTNLSFALNLRVSGLSLPPLHCVNIALHGGCGLLVWLLLRNLLDSRRLALLGALLFVAHPLQTQSVTYLIQRATVLGAFFFLLAFFCHLRMRSALAAGCRRYSRQHLRLWLGTLAAGGCAVLAKENTATLPLVLIVYDQLCPLPVRRGFWQAAGDYLPFFVMPLIVGIPVFLGVLDAGSSVLYAPLTASAHNGPLHYLVTQFSVVWIYLRLLLIPYGQALEHNYPVVANLLTVQNGLALSGLVAAGLLAWKVRRRRPLLTFGAAWFLLALAVESSIIPLDPLFEHRLYLPMFGFLLALLDGLAVWPGESGAVPVLALALLVCGPLTWQRNALWNDPIAFYEDNLRKVPRGERASETLATLYGKVGRFKEQRLLLEQSLGNYPRNPVVRENLAKAYAGQNRWDEAYAVLEEGMRLQPSMANYYETAAVVATMQGDRQLAADYLIRGIAVDDVDRRRLLNDLGVLYSESGDAVRAEEALRKSLEIDPESKETWLNLGKEYYVRGRWEEALAALRQAARFGPGNAETLEGLGRVALELADEDTARWAAGKLRSSDRDAWRRLQAEIERKRGRGR